MAHATAIAARSGASSQEQELNGTCEAPYRRRPGPRTSTFLP
jgi:hypothetical protein